jgi:AmiR/NasT family two-component response regulator
LSERAARQQHPWESRIAIEQAKGALAQIHGCSPDDAFVMLRAYCRNNGRRLGDVAHAVANRAPSVADLSTRRA